MARYLEGDKITTKIGSGRDRDQGGLPDFLKNRDRDRGDLPDFQNFRGNSRKVEANLDSPRLLAKSLGESGYPRVFPYFRLKSRGESRFGLDLSRLLSRLFEEICQKSQGESRFGLDLSRLLSRLFEEVQAPRSRLKIEIEIFFSSRSRFSVEIGEASAIDLAHPWYKLKSQIQ